MPDELEIELSDKNRARAGDIVERRKPSLDDDEWSEWATFGAEARIRYIRGAGMDVEILTGPKKGEWWSWDPRYCKLLRRGPRRHSSATLRKLR